MTKINKERLIDFTERQLRDIFTKAGLNSQNIDKAIADYTRYRESELSSLSILSYKDLQSLGADTLTDELFKLRDGGELVEEILINYLDYINLKKQIAKIYQESKSWDKVIIANILIENNDALESFIDYVEENYQTKIKDGKHLQKLTGITEETLEELEVIVIKYRFNKYFRALEVALQEKAKYKDLLQIKPKDFELPQNWSGCLGSDQYSSILWALSFEFMINEPTSLMLIPDLRSIAQEVEAPYSVLMDCYNLFKK